MDHPIGGHCNNHSQIGCLVADYKYETASMWTYPSRL